MNLRQYLLLLINEESNEIAKEAGKAIRFGLFEHHPDDPSKLTNEVRIENEFIDLIASLFVANVYDIKISPIIIEMTINSPYRDKIIARIDHIIKFMRASVCEGQITSTLVEINNLNQKIKDRLNELILPENI